MIGIIGAMEDEVAQLKKNMEIEETTEVASLSFCRGKLSGKEVVVVRSGIGKVNAAICTQILVDQFHVDVIINTGIAGSLDAEIDIGDIVISTDAVEHDMDASIFGDSDRSVFLRWIHSLSRTDESLVKLAKKQTRKPSKIVHT